MIDPVDELARAALWQAERRTRAMFQRHLWASLAAPPEPAMRVRALWEPMITLAAQERPEYEPPRDTPLSKQTNVGRTTE